jgi:hypothetical protein
VVTSTDQLPWLSGQWRLAESEIAWARMDPSAGDAPPVLSLRLSVACWRAQADQDWRYWPGVTLRFTLASPLHGPADAPLSDLLGRITHGEVRDAIGGQASDSVMLTAHPATPPALWTIQLRSGESWRWQSLSWQAWCDAGRAPAEWLHC